MSLSLSPFYQAGLRCRRVLTHGLLTMLTMLTMLAVDGPVVCADMPEIAHITGIGTDGHLYGLDADDTVLASRDVGLTWFTPATVAPIDAAVPNYSFDVNALTTTPRDDDVVAAGSVLWGLTSQGVHYNTNGTWVLHAMWASNCAGACGLECNQPTPNLIER